jgi:hypothetical protein
MAIKTVPQTQTTLVHVIASARAELQALLQRGIDLAEQRTKSMFRFARTVSKRVGGRKTKRRR